jgi:hypothetical protein
VDVKRLSRVVADELAGMRSVFVSETRKIYNDFPVVHNAIGYAKFRSRSHNVVIRVYDEAGNVIETHEHAGDFKEP